MPRQKVDPIREQALKILRRTETSLSFPRLLIEHSVEEAVEAQRDKAFAYQLVMGTLRHRGALDWALSKLCGAPLDELTSWIRNILRMGLFQILFLDRVPQSAAVNESVKLAKKYGHRGTAGLVNAVLRNADKEALLHELQSLDEESLPNLAAKYSHPPWLVELFVEEWGRQEAVEIMKRNNAIPPLTARVNTLRVSRDSLLSRLESQGVSARALPHTGEAIEFLSGPAPWSLPSHEQGLFYIQDVSSMLATHCLDAKPGQRILDACAGPGGKATHIAALMNNTGTIYALDIHRHRAELVDQHARRLGVGIIETRLQDATAPLAERYGEMDAVIVDAPCSALGVIRRRVDLKWRLRPGQIDELAGLQRRILQSTAECVKPGGILLYCTCTLTRTENREVVEAFLGSHPGFRPDPKLPEFLGKCVTREGFAQIMPGQCNMDGFFIARLRRL